MGDLVENGFLIYNYSGADFQRSIEKSRDEAAKFTA